MLSFTLPLLSCLETNRDWSKSILRLREEHSKIRVSGNNEEIRSPFRQLRRALGSSQKGLAIYDVSDVSGKDALI
jgi:hypothetical protein